MKPVSVTEIAHALGMTRQGVARRAQKEGWLRTGDSREVAFDPLRLPVDVQARIASQLVETPDPDTSDEIFKSASDKSRLTAALKASLISTCKMSGLAVEDFAAAYNDGLVNPSLLANLGPRSAKTIYRWMKEQKEDGIDGLVPKYQARATLSRSIPMEQQQMLVSWYCTPNRPSIRKCWMLLARAVGNPPSYVAVQRYIRKLPKPYVEFMRLGANKFDAHYQPFIDRDPTLYRPMQQVLSDHHNWDFLVTKDGRVFRPWITVFQDYRSAKILGWCPSVYPSSLSIAVAYYRMVLEYGAPELIHIDNGKDYRSTVINGKTQAVKVLNEEGITEESLVYIQGIFGLCGSDVTFAKPYHGQSKGRVERTFGTFAEYFAKSFPTYVGSNTVARHEDTALFYRALNGKAKRDVLVDWDFYIRAMDAAITDWNATWPHTGKGLNGRTPDAVFAEFKGPPRMVDKETLALAFSRAEVRTVSRNGIELDGVSYWAPELFEHQGRQVIARRQLHTLDAVIVTDLRGAVLCTALANWFDESGNLSIDVGKVERARSDNRKKLLEFTGQLREGPTYVDLALQNASNVLEFPSLPDYPHAAGSEVSAPTATSLRSPLDAGLED